MCIRDSGHSQHGHSQDGHAMTRTTAPARKRKPMGMARRPGFLTYGILIALLAGGAYPLWWSFVVGSSPTSVLSQDWPPLMPGGQFWKNVAAVFDTIPFWQAPVSYT